MSFLCHVHGNRPQLHRTAPLYRLLPKDDHSVRIQYPLAGFHDDCINAAHGYDQGAVELVIPPVKYQA